MIELTMAFEAAYREPKNDAVIAGIYAYSDWCLNARSGADTDHDPVTAVMVAFLEDLPKIKAARAELPRWLSYEEVSRNKRVFAYLIGDDGFADLLEHMRRNRRHYVDRPRDGRWPVE